MVEPLRFFHHLKGECVHASIAITLNAGHPLGWLRQIVSVATDSGLIRRAAALGVTGCLEKYRQISVLCR